MSKIRHRNIIEFYGICKTGSDFYIVTEYAESGSLYDHLHHDENMEIDFDTVLRWAREVGIPLEPGGDGQTLDSRRNLLPPL